MPKKSSSSNSALGRWHIKSRGLNLAQRRTGRKSLAEAKGGRVMNDFNDDDDDEGDNQMVAR